MKTAMMAAILLAASLLAPRLAVASDAADASAKLEAFAGVDHFAADPGGPYKGVADPKLHARLNNVVDAAATSVAAGIRKGRTVPELMQRLGWQLWLIDPKTLDAQDGERTTQVFKQLLVLAGLDEHDGILIQWLYEYDEHKPPKPAPLVPSGN